MTEHVIIDGWRNVITNLGSGLKDASPQTTYGLRAPIPKQTIDAMWRQNGVFARYIMAVPKFATRRWFRIQSEDEDFSLAMLEATRRLRLKKHAKDAMKWQRLYGGGAWILGVDDGQDPEEPLNPGSIRSFDFINTVHRWDLTPERKDENPLSPTYKEPEVYRLTHASQLIHASRVVPFRGIEMDDLQLEASEDTWGAAYIERVWEEFRQYGSVYAYTETILKSLFQAVAKFKGLHQTVAKKGGAEKVQERLNLMNYASSALNMVLLDEEESYELRSLSVAGIPELMVKFMDKLSAVTEIPLSVLFGQAPTGLSTDDESAKRNFYDSIANEQEEVLRDPITRVIELLSISEKIPLPKSWSIEFIPLDQPNEMEISTRRKQDADTDAVYIAQGVIVPEEARERLRSDPGTPYSLSEDPEGFADPAEVEEPEPLEAPDAGSE